MSAVLSPRPVASATLPPGHRLAQQVIAVARAHRDRCSPEAAARELFPDDLVAIGVARTATTTADTTTTAWASSLVADDARALLRDMQAESAFAALASAGVAEPFGGASAVIVPSASPLGLDGGAWIGEGGAFPMLQGTVGNTRLPALKLGGLVMLSRELEQAGAVGAMRMLLRRTLATLLDSALLDSGAGVAGVRPAGVRAGAGLGTGAAGGGVSAAAADVATLLGELESEGFGIAPVFIASIGTAAALRMLVGMGSGLTIVGTRFVASDVLLCVDGFGFSCAFDPPEVDTALHATVTAADADGVAPTQAGAAAGGGALGTAGQVVRDGGIPIAGGSGASVAGAQSISAFQTWSIVLRIAQPVNWSALPGSVVGVDGITWAAAA